MFHHFRVSKNVRDKRSFSDTRFSVELFCLTVPRIFVGDCCSISLISGGIHVFPSKLICLTIPKHFIRELLCAVSQKSSSSEKVSRRDGAGEYQDLPSKVFVSKCRKFS